MKKIVIELSETDYDSLLVDMLDPQELVSNFVETRVAQCQSKIIKVSTDWHIRNEQQMSVKKTDIIRDAFDKGLIMTLEEKTKTQQEGLNNSIEKIKSS